MKQHKLSDVDQKLTPLMTKVTSVLGITINFYQSFYTFNPIKEIF